MNNQAAQTMPELQERVLYLLAKHGGWAATLDYIADLERTLSQTAGVVDGWKLVPVEPTEVMCEAAISSLGWTRSEAAAKTAPITPASPMMEGSMKVWSAMLAAAPAASGGEDFSCCGGNDETPKLHCMDCPRTAPEPLAQGGVAGYVTAHALQHLRSGDSQTYTFIRAERSDCFPVPLYASPQPAAEAEIVALRAELARIEENGTPWVPELLEWLEKHDCCPELPFTDYELIESLEARFGTPNPPQPSASVGERARQLLAKEYRSHGWHEDAGRLCMGGDVTSFVEDDALRVITRLIEQGDEDTHVITELGRLLASIAVILKGPEPAGTAWSYHDLPDMVQALTQQRGAEDGRSTSYSREALEIQGARWRALCRVIDHMAPGWDSGIVGAVDAASAAARVLTAQATTPQPSADAVREVPDGMVLVPREPTPEMVRAGAIVTDHVTRAIQVYSAMLSAATDHQQNAAQGGGEK